MYPWLRFFLAACKARKLPALAPFETAICHHRCLPGDIDPWAELNNGRTLTMFDLGRVPLSIRTGIFQIARKNGWSMAIAGASVRYRKRVKLFQKVELRSRLLGWDKRFLYLEQSMWRGEECTSQAVLRSAITKGARGILDPRELAKALNISEESPPLPDWVNAWSQAEEVRPWPPKA